MALNARNANVAYNYQKNPNAVSTDKSQTLAGLAIALRDNPNYNRNVNTIFPVNIATPNLGAGSPTLGATAIPDSLSLYPYAGRQISGLGEIT